MKNIAILLMMFFVGFSFAQQKKDTYVQKGDLIEATLYHDNGEIEQHGFFKDKKLHGTWTYYNEQGEKLSIGNYEFGVKTGKWYFYTKTKVKEVDYDKGRIINVVETSRES
ncbi:MAG: nicotinic acid mononucleotide adenyltransferase [Flavobacteriaceae bacterium]|nr:nicotinic acid mononucleotide adenyltransferase [Flavobacteriaceae bacterium]